MSDLTQFVAAMGGEQQLRVEETLDAGFVRLRVAEAERRQAKHDIRCTEDIVIEMLRNARDAGAHHIYLAFSKEGDMRTLVMLDDGDGIPPSMHKAIFEARVTSKLESVHMDRWGIHGRGMALYSIAQNALSAEVVASDKGLGSSLKVVTNTAVLTERKDQSTWPQVGENEEGQKICTTGPHNIIRTCAEFALEEKGGVEVYIGSAAEIVATAHRRTHTKRDASEMLFMDSLEELPLLEQLYFAADAQELLRCSERLGLEMSERTAHRIIAGTIKPVRSVFSRLYHRKDAPEQQVPVDLYKDRRNLKVDKNDQEEFARILERDFAFLSERYYLSLTKDPHVSFSKGKVRVTFEFEESD